MRFIPTLIAGSVLAAAPAADRQPYLDVLLDALRTQSGFVKVHAADALLDHGVTREVAAAFEHEVDTAAPPYRIGVWRSMARATPPEAARTFIDRMRTAMLDERGPDRVHAAESLAKLGQSFAADRDALKRWLPTMSPADQPFVHWLLVLSADPAARAADEAELARFLGATDPMSRLRAAYCISRLKGVSSATVEALRTAAVKEPHDSIGRVYLLAASAIHHASEAQVTRDGLIEYLQRGKPNEQLEAATVLGKTAPPRHPDTLERLAPLLRSPEADARIGAASGSLHLLR